MPTTAALLEEIKVCEEKLGTARLVAAAVEKPEIVLAKNGVAIREKRP